jgi:CRP/FNR family cyclic AMP-dependent transcriptional regulator
MNDRMTKLLAEVELFSELDSEELAKISALAQTRTVTKDSPVFHAGDAADAVFVIGKGKVKIVTTTSDGHEFILTVLGAGQVFGEMALLESAPRSASVIAVTAAELIMLGRREFQHILDTSPSISRKLLTILSRRLRRANSTMESLAYMDVAGRLARFLLDLARDHGQRMGNGWVVLRRPTHSDIAHSIGTSRETVSRLINEFEEGFGLVNKGKFTYIRETLLG